MSDWFRSVPHFVDAAANAAKVPKSSAFPACINLRWSQFQQETMSSLIRYYKERNMKFMDRLRSEAAERKALKQYADAPSFSLLLPEF